MKEQQIHVSKFLSFVLRHKPEQIGLMLDDAGWASVDELIQRAKAAGEHLTFDLISEVVATNDKQRFALSADGKYIRANQGHSVQIDLKLEPLEPPSLLYHGTATRFLDAILEQGLIPGSRQYVHLSPDETTARKVGQRHGKPVILRVKAGEMHAAGFLFYKSANGVWLTSRVPPEYLIVNA